MSDTAMKPFIFTCIGVTIWICGAAIRTKVVESEGNSLVDPCSRCGGYIQALSDKTKND